MSEQPAERHLERIDLTAVNDSRGTGCPTAVAGWPDLTRCGRPITWELRIVEDDTSITRGTGYCAQHTHAAMAEAQDDETSTWHWLGT